MTEASFYADKQQDLPRRIYRNLHADLSPDLTVKQRSAVITSFLKTVKLCHTRDEFLRMKLIIPSFLRENLSPAEKKIIEETFSELREKRRHRLDPIYPICSDEFVFDRVFFQSVFRHKREPIFSRSNSIYGVGSCFVLNIARYLSGKGYAIEAFRRAEDINSVFGNTLMFSLLQQDKKTIGKFVRTYLPQLDSTNEQYEKLIKKEVKILEQLKTKLSTTDIIIVTLGNTIDAFMSEDEDFGCPSVFPRFLNAFQDVTVKGQTAITQVIKSYGGKYRLSGVSETLPVIGTMFKCLMSLNPKAKIFTTVSPVAINNTMGISEYDERGPIEADCASKSTLRACLEEVLQDDIFSRVRYFPSFEIVRWLGSTSAEQVFGRQDAASTHVSDQVLASIYDYFEYLYAEGNEHQ